MSHFNDDIISKVLFTVINASVFTIFNCNQPYLQPYFTKKGFQIDARLMALLANQIEGHGNLPNQRASSKHQFEIPPKFLLSRFIFVQSTQEKRSVTVVDPVSG